MADDKKNNAAKEDKKPEQPKKPVAQKLIVDCCGENGQYTFDIQVISDQQCGFKSSVLIIEGNKNRTTLPTDDCGYVTHKAQLFSEEEREFLFKVIGTELSYEMTLGGPEQPKAKPKEKISLVSGGFMANMKNVIRQNRERKES